MTAKKEKRGFSNFGFSTILLAFVMICVAIFSVLSFVTAYSDYKLSKKVADKTEAYYTAEEQAYDKLAIIDELLSDAYDISSNEEEYYANVEKFIAEYGIIDKTSERFMLSFEEDINEDQYLSIKLSILYPTNIGDSFLDIIEWKSVYDIAIPEDETLNLIQ